MPSSSPAKAVAIINRYSSWPMVNALTSGSQTVWLSGMVSGTSTDNAENSDSPVPAAEPREDPSPVDETEPDMALSSQAPADFRIDEDILTQIQADSDRQ